MWNPMTSCVSGSTSSANQSGSVRKMLTAGRSHSARTREAHQLSDRRRLGEIPYASTRAADRATELSDDTRTRSLFAPPDRLLGPMQPIDWVGRHHTRRMPSPIHNDFQVRSDRQPEFARRSIITLSCGKVSILCNQEWILDRPEDVLETHQSSPWPLPNMLPGRGRKLHRQSPRVSHAPEYIHSRETSSLRVPSLGSTLDLPQRPGSVATRSGRS
jgi:hypothetical protein